MDKIRLSEGLHTLAVCSCNGRACGLCQIAESPGGISIPATPDPWEGYTLGHRVVQQSASALHPILISLANATLPISEPKRVSLIDALDFDNAHSFRKLPFPSTQENRRNGSQFNGKHSSYQRHGYRNTYSASSCRAGGGRQPEDGHP